MNFRIIAGLALLVSLVDAPVHGQQQQNAERLTTAEIGPLEAGYRTDDAVDKHVPSQIEIGDGNEPQIAVLNQVRQEIENAESIVIDGRPLNQFTGEVPGKVFHTGKEHQRRGHITSSVNMPWPENLDEDGKFKSIDDLQKMYAVHEIDVARPVVTYCNEGFHATMPWFVLHELLKYPQIRVYDDSLSQWANRNDTPMKTGK